MLGTYWYKNAIIYEVYTRAFFDSNKDGNGDLIGLTKKLDYLQKLGVNCIWLLPIYSSPFKDDGYDISDYRSIHPDFGNVEDLHHLIKQAHKRNLCVIMDLVVNHTSDQHPWFQAARTDRNSPYHDYYVWSDTDKKYSGVRIIFTDTEKSNWTWDPVAGQFFWHRFYSSQPDLNYENPKVQEEILEVMKFWLDMGIDGFRVDAVPYLFEREGTNCENLPETHVYLRRMRKFVEDNYPGRILLCEANQWPKDVRAYFGDGDEFQMAFHFPLMPRIYMALRQGRRDAIVWALSQTPPIPDSCQWVTFLRNHDELTLEMVTPEERDWMWREYASDPHMRLNLGIRRRLAPLLDNDKQKIILANALLFSLPGTPSLYYGDEIGMGDDIDLPDRNGVRTPMQWDNSRNAGFSKAEKTYSPVISKPPFSPETVNAVCQMKQNKSLWKAIHKMINLRKKHPVFASGSLELVNLGNESILAFTRQDDRDRIFAVLNLSDKEVKAIIPATLKLGKAVDLWSGGKLDFQKSGQEIQVQPHGFFWFAESNPRQ